MSSAAPASYSGPFAGGPPPSALAVTYPPIDRFGWREVGRAVQVVAVLVLEVLKGLGPVLRRRERLAESVSAAIVDAFERLGPTFVKLGQLIASSPGLFPAVIAEACRRTLDRVEVVDVAFIRRVIAEDLGVDPDKAFKAFDAVPLSAASVAQVHACTLHDGRDAVVKVQRPDIGPRMNVDLRILHRVARLAAHSRRLAMANPVAVIEDLHRVTNEELNFALEADRQSRFRANIGAFGDNVDVTTPEVYWDLCGPRVICMQRLYGTPVDRFAGDPEMGQRLLREAVKAWLEAACIHGPFHGDIHAGNLWILDDGQIAFLDFGIMGELPPDWRATFRDLLRTLMVDGDYTRAAASLQTMGVIPSEAGTPEEVGARLELLIAPLLASTMATVSLGEVLQLALSTASDLGGLAAPELVLLGKMVLYVERYMTTLAPDWALAQDHYLISNLFPPAGED